MQKRPLYDDYNDIIGYDNGHGSLCDENDIISDGKIHPEANPFTQPNLSCQ